MNHIEAMKHEHEFVCGKCVKCGASIEKQEPVAWVTDLEFDRETELIPARRKGQLGTNGMDIPLYAQPQREWVGLTMDEIDLLEELYAPPVHPDFTNDSSHCLELIRHVEAKLKEKNGVS